MTQKVETCRPKIVFYVVNCCVLTDSLCFICHIIKSTFKSHRIHVCVCYIYIFLVCSTVTLSVAHHLSPTL